MLAAVIAAGLSFAPSATAPDSPVASRHATALAACRALIDPAARLACYDREIPLLLDAAKNRDVVLIDRDEVRRTRHKTFGFDMSSIGILSGAPGNKEDAADISRLETKVVSGRSIGNGKWRFVIEGGAVWETLEANSGFDDPKPGATVLLERGSFGGYFAKIGRGRSVQAHRVG